MRLALDSTRGVTLAGAEIEAQAQWHPRIVEPVPVQHGIPRVRISAGSAAFLFPSSSIFTDSVRKPQNQPHGNCENTLMNI
jgi:hypothetical protein